MSGYRWAELTKRASASETDVTLTRVDAANGTYN